MPIYKDKDGWSTAEYDAKIAWTRSVLKAMPTDVWGFQELWHAEALAEVFDDPALRDIYDLVVPGGHAGGGIVCGAAVRKGMIEGEPEWIAGFPEAFRLTSTGDDPQTPAIAVSIPGFSRPVLRMSVRPLATAPAISIFVCHLKSKSPTEIWREGWYEKAVHSPHAEALGSALSTIRRTAEAAALRMILTGALKGTDMPVIVLGDVNDGRQSNTLNVLTGQPNYLLSGLSEGGSDVDLYTAGTLQLYRSESDVYYTHVFRNSRESLDQIMVSQEFYDNAKKRVWAFDGLVIVNDHLNGAAGTPDHKAAGTSDHGIVRAAFIHRPRRD
jgi:hypothetical protein